MWLISICTYRKARGQLRTKIESGEGTIPVKSSDGIQTWDGVNIAIFFIWIWTDKYMEFIAGDARTTIANNVMLWQNCPLECGRCARCSSLIDNSANLFVLSGSGQFIASGSHVSVRRFSFSTTLNWHCLILLKLFPIYSAVCGRIETSIQGLPPPYFLNKPKFALVTSTETRNQIKAPNFGINWTISQRTVEVVNSLTGKTVNNKVSRLTKQIFFGRYANLIKQLPNLRISRSITGDYSETKQAAREYQIAKRELFDAFRREDLGSWLKKPIEQDNFNLPKWHDFDVIDTDVIDTDFISVDKQFMYAPRAQSNLTKNLTQQSTTTTTTTTGNKKVLNTRRYCDKGKQTNKIVDKHNVMMHRIGSIGSGGGNRKPNAGFVTFKE